LIKINQLDNGLAISRNTRSKYVANDLRIKTASRQLRQGLITIRMFLLKCSYSVASYEERMRAMVLIQNINEENAPNGQGEQNDEERVFEDGMYNNS